MISVSGFDGDLHRALSLRFWHNGNEANPRSKASGCKLLMDAVHTDRI